MRILQNGSFGISVVHAQYTLDASCVFKVLYGHYSNSVSMVGVGVWLGVSQGYDYDRCGRGCMSFSI